MSTSDTLHALRRANPRSEPGFGDSVRAAASMRARIVASTIPEPSLDRATPAGPRLRLGRIGLRVAGAAAVAAAIVAGFLTVDVPGGGRGGGVQTASAAVRTAAATTEASAEFSGAATVVIVHNGELWAGKTVRWNDGNLAVVENTPGRAGLEMRVVDDMLYAHDHNGRWAELGDPDSIDPDSGTTPDELLAVTRADVGGDTLSSISAGMSGLQTRQLDDGSTVYRGTVEARLVAPETGFKEGEHIRVFPFGYVAHDEAADPASPLDVSITVGADGVIRELAVAWGGGDSVWTYTVTYSDLGTTPPIEAPANAEPFPDRTPVAPAG